MIGFEHPYWETRLTILRLIWIWISSSYTASPQVQHSEHCTIINEY